MSKFIYNRFSGDSIANQYKNHLQNESYVNSINQIQNSNSEEIQKIISGTSREQIKVIQNSSKAICGEINKGFSIVADKLDDTNFRLNEINEGINNLTSMLDYKTDLLIEQSRITNEYLAGITIQFLIPESQKQRGYHIEKGLVYLKSALNENPSSTFFNDSYEEFIKAKEIEPKDYYTLYRLGIIHFTSLQHLNLKLAEEYFTQTVKYAKAFCLANSSGTHNIINNRVSGIVNEPNAINEEIIQSLILASNCAQLQDKIKVAIGYAEEAYNRASEKIKSGLVLAKLHAMDKNPQNSARIVESLLVLYPKYSLEIINDIELMVIPEVTDKLLELSNEKCKEAEIEFDRCKKNLIKTSFANNIFIEIESRIANLNYLSSHEILNDLRLPRIWKWELGEMRFDTLMGLYKDYPNQLMRGEFPAMSLNLIQFLKSEKNHTIFD